MSEIENHTQAGVSPVTGGKFQSYKNKTYAKKKQKLTGSTVPDLHLKDNMIESIHAGFKENSIDFKITDPLEKKKSFNHNTGDTVRKRQHIPNDSDTRGRGVGFSKPIRDGIRDILKEIHADKSQE